MSSKSPKVPASATNLPVRHLDFQSSAYGGVIPVFGGEVRLSPNIVWADFFKSHAIADTPSGTKKGGGFTNYTYVYTVSVIYVLGEGAIDVSYNPSGVLDRINCGLARPGGAVAPIADSVVRVRGEPAMEIPGGTPDPQPIRGVEPGGWRGKKARAIGPKQGVFKGSDWFAWEPGYGPITDAKGRTIARYITSVGDIIANAFHDGAVKRLTKITTPGNRHYAPENYPGSAALAIEVMHLGANAQIPNWAFSAYRLRYWETDGVASSPIPHWARDAAPDRLLRDFLTNRKHGGWGYTDALLAMLPGYDPALGDFSDFWFDGDNSWGAYVRANEMLISPVVDQQTTLAQVIDSFAVITDSAPLWSEGLLKMIPLGDAVVTSARTGITYTPETDPTVYTTGANIGIRAALALVDFLFDDDPVEVDRKALTPDEQSSAGVFNQIRVEYKDRSNAYQIEQVEAENAASVHLRGPLPRPADTLHAITTRELAQTTADRLLSRFAEKRNTHVFTLGAWRLLLEPLDVVTIPGEAVDPNLAGTTIAVRLVSTDMNADHEIQCEAERYPAAVAPVPAPDLPDPVDTLPEQGVFQGGMTTDNGSAVEMFADVGADLYPGFELAADRAPFDMVVAFSIRTAFTSETPAGVSTYWEMHVQLVVEGEAMGEPVVFGRSENYVTKFSDPVLVPEGYRYALRFKTYDGSGAPLPTPDPGAGVWINCNWQLFWERVAT